MQEQVKIRLQTKPNKKTESNGFGYIFLENSRVIQYLKYQLLL